MGETPRSRGWCGIHVRPRNPDGSFSETSSQEHVAKVARKIDKLVNQSSFHSDFEAALAELRLLQARERQEKQDLKRYRVEHPEHLVMPSIAKLEIYGYWIMSDEVLEILLGRVLRNVRELNECMTEDYSMDTLVRVTQSMSWTQVCYGVSGSQSYILAPRGGSEEQMEEVLVDDT
ncbi:MAG: hypothetical protein BYD32DRAFT_465844 [Podila humilis]|nr:MAG: hypothetical protein BYD32DRAFT_465844 [Podila humilis]